MENGNEDQDLKIIKDVEELIFSNIKLGVDVSELSILDDVNTSKSKIQELGLKIENKNSDLIVCLLDMARSVHFGHAYQGTVADFFGAVIRLGADRVKILLLFRSLFFLGKGREAKVRAAKSFSISILSRMIARDMNLKDEIVRKVETGGLLSQLGINLFLIARELEMDISDEFISKYEVTLATAVVERLKLDAFFKKTVDVSIVEFDEDSLSLVGIITLAEALTEDSFRKFGKLVLKSPLPDASGVLLKTPGDDITKLFGIVGLEEFLDVKEILTQRQKEARDKASAAHRK